jgi:predicted transcriptional regulator of viral defense system
MTKVDAFQLHQALPREEFDHGLLRTVLAGYSAIPQKINQLLRAGIITRVKKGLYVFGPAYHRAPVCKETLANLIYGPSCVSLQSALAFHGLIPERVETLTSVTPKRDKDFKTPLGGFTYRYLRADRYPHGITQVWIDSQHPVLMASPEKALCDYLVLGRIGGLNSAADAQAFLRDDLRIDPTLWARFDLKALRGLNRAYRSKAIEPVIEALEEAR